MPFLHVLLSICIPYHSKQSTYEMYTSCASFETASADISQLIRKYQEIPVYIRIQIPKADGPPQLKLPFLSVSHFSMFIEPIRNSQLIRKCDMKLLHTGMLQQHTIFQVDFHSFAK